jgi:hypothetical protein
VATSSRLRARWALCNGVGIDGRGADSIRANARGTEGCINERRQGIRSNLAGHILASSRCSLWLDGTSVQTHAASVRSTV